MKLSSFLTLLCSSAVLASDLDLASRGPKCPQKEGYKDAQTISSWKEQGLCFRYLGAGNFDKAIAPCAGPYGYCQKVNKSESGVEGCKAFPNQPEIDKLDPSTILKDEDCNEFIPGQCMCECGLCDEISKVIIEGLEQLDNVICAVMLSAFKTIADVGLMFVPGGQASSGVKAAVQGAKSFYENGEDAASFFGNWIGPACGVPDFDFDLSMVFNPLVEAPDSMSRGKTVGCKKKSGCRKVDPVPDPEPKTKPTVEPRGKPKHKPTWKPTIKSTDKPKTTAQKSTAKPTDKPETPTQKPTVKPSDKPKTTTQKPTVKSSDKPTTTEKSTSTTITTRASSITSSSSTPGAGCAYCGEFENKAARDDKYQNMYARVASGNKNNAPSCAIPPKRDYIAKEDLSGTFLDRLIPRVFSLIRRALSEKKVVTVLYGFKWDLYVGKYAPSSEAVNFPEITKYWAFEDPGSSQKCSVEVVKTNTGNIANFQTDHVYEAQTLSRFVNWLMDEKNPNVGIAKTYTKPKMSWVKEVLVDEEGPNPFNIIKPGDKNVGDLNTPSGGENTITLMAYGFGRSDGVKTYSQTEKKWIERIPATRGNKNLVLLHENINGPKGQYFLAHHLHPKCPMNETRADCRGEGVGPFKYLAAEDGNTDTIWKKWARVSNWIDLVCYEFDRQYKWGSRSDEPKNSKGTASLRSLYAYFIDTELAEIEAKAAKFAEDAQKQFDKRCDIKTLTPDEKKWRDDAFEKTKGNDGWCTAEKLKFPRPRVPRGASVYGAYGWKDVTFDAANKNPSIGVPVKIP